MEGALDKLRFGLKVTQSSHPYCRQRFNSGDCHHL
jgi:hypothetical protein